MKAVLGVAPVLLLLLAQAAAAQQPPVQAKEIPQEIEAVMERSGLDTALDSIARTSAPELEEALEQLTATLGVVAARVANDPELRMAAVRTAEGLVGVAQVAVEERSDELQEALRALAERLALSSAAVPDEVR